MRLEHVLVVVGGEDGDGGEDQLEELQVQRRLVGDHAQGGELRQQVLEKGSMSQLDP